MRFLRALPRFGQNGNARTDKEDDAMTMRGLRGFLMCMTAAAFIAATTAEAASGPSGGAALHGRKAYASLAEPEAVVAPAPESGAARIPRAFSFKPDSSPVILASVNSPGPDGRNASPARNANLYRRLYGGGRQAAEIIEREPVNPRPSLDTPAMAPPADGTTPRAEVKLPSSSRGVGMANEYSSGR